MKKYFCLCVLAIIVISCRQKTNDNPEGQPDISTEVEPFSMQLLSDVMPDTAKFIAGTLFNNTPIKAEFGEYYKLHFWNDSVWEQVVPDELMITIDIAYILPENRWTNFKYYLSQTSANKPGKYRLSNEVTISLDKIFYVSDSQRSQENDVPLDDNTNNVFMWMENDTLASTTDTIRFSVTNHTSADIFPLEHCFFSYYDEATENWLDYYFSPYKFDEKRKLKPGETTEFHIALNVKKKWLRYPSGKPALKDKQYMLPGKYRIRKYTHIPVSAEFIFSSDKKVAETYTKTLNENPLNNMAEYMGGDSVMNAFLKQQMRYPIPKEQIKDFAFVQCELDIDSLGHASNPKIRYLQDSVFTDESLRLLSLLKNWIPARNTKGKQPSTKTIIIEFGDR